MYIEVFHKVYLSENYLVNHIFSNPFEIIPINQEDIIENLHIHIKSDKLRYRISGKYFNHSKPFSMRTTYKFESSYEKW